MAKKISKERFNLYAIGTRHSMIQLTSIECSWWADLNETILGAVVYDKLDNSFNWIILIRDENQKFRCTDLKTDYKSKRLAEAELRIKISSITCSPDFNEIVEQKDCLGNGLQLITPIEKDSSKWHLYFKELLESSGREPGRKVIWEIGNWLYPKDNHFTKEFQMAQFDQRIWEIYLWAAFREMGYDVIQHEAPDFQCKSTLIEVDFSVEATTVAPSAQGVLSKHPNPHTPEEYEKFLDTYMPIKFASALTSKLTKRNAKGLAYWEQEFVKQKPFILAIADFHKAADVKDFPFGSMIYSQSALYIYLYGSRINWEVKDGQLIIINEKVSEIKYKTKTIASGFFEQPDSENISGVLFSNAGTLAKFDRMGVIAGFKAKGHKYFRTGLKFDPDPNAFVGKFFSSDIEDEKYKESWCDELQFFHNPNARYPLPKNWLPNVTQHYYIDNKLYSLDSYDRVLSSITTIFKETM